MSHDISLYRGAELETILPDEWLAMHELSRRAVDVAIPLTRRTQQEIDYYVGWPDTEHFTASRKDPNIDVSGVVSPIDERRFRAEQEYSNPRLAIARRDERIIGFASGADNVSGQSEEIRRRKQRSVIKNYFWLREVVVDPSAQRQHIGKELGRTMLKGIFPIRPVVTYIFPEDLPAPIGALTHAGFTPSHHEELYDNAFGPDAKPARMVRMQARSALEARSKSRLSFSGRRNSQQQQA